MDTTIKEHGRDIKYFYTKFSRMDDDISAIKASINQIKWVATGGLAFYVIENIGLLEALTI
jgi:hypothetical protein